jgi:hypothetical protein
MIQSQTHDTVGAPLYGPSAAFLNNATPPRSMALRGRALMIKALKTRVTDP